MPLLLVKVSLFALISLWCFDPADAELVCRQMFPVKKGKGEWKFEIEEDGVHSQWKVEKSVLIMELSAKHTGWVGFGFCKPRVKLSEDRILGNMQNCDLVLAWVDEHGVTQICDAYSKQNGPPDKDPQQDCTVISGSDAGGITRIRFQRPLYTGDSDKWDVNLKKPVLLAWAHSNTKPKAEKIEQCGVRGHPQGGNYSGLYEEQAVLMEDALRHQEMYNKPDPNCNGCNPTTISSFHGIGFLVLNWFIQSGDGR